MWKPWVIAMGLLIGLLGVACGADNSITIKEADYGQTWPLTIPKATLICEGYAAVFVQADGKRYGVNGFGKTYVAKSYPLTSRDLEIIWRPDPRGIKPRADISPLLSDGLDLCE